MQRVSRAATGGGRQPRVPGSRAESPGRALRDVQAKLNEYANQQAQQEAAANIKQYGEHARSASQAPTAAAPARKAQNDDTSAEIADIDARLNALQSFLQNAGSQGD